MTLLLVLIAVVVVALAVWFVRGLQRRTAEAGAKEEHLQEHAQSRLVYRVPPGQDPTVLVSALERRGYVAVADTTGGPVRLHVDVGQSGGQREEVRSIIEDVDTTLPEDGVPVHVGAVRFEDEEQA